MTVSGCALGYKQLQPPKQQFEVLPMGWMHCLRPFPKWDSRLVWTRDFPALFKSGYWMAEFEDVCAVTFLYCLYISSFNNCISCLWDLFLILLSGFLQPVLGFWTWAQLGWEAWLSSMCLGCIPPLSDIFKTTKKKYVMIVNLLCIRITGILHQVGCFFVLKQEVLDGIHPFVCRLWSEGEA